MKNFFFGVLATLLTLLLGAFVYLRLGCAEVRGDLPASRWETALTNSAVHASVRRSAPEIPNPVDPTEENLIAGGAIYLDACSGCHGDLAKPDVNDIAHSLYPPVPQFPRVGTEYTEAQIFWIAKHGLRRTGMFANGKWESDQRLWTAAAFIKRIRALPPAVLQALAAPKSGK
ncbi:MAG TPA: c-type cytochrome [Candidatus Acidoferrales bacterium]|nr:c-type cytochrome [Candidatus Acidoferrales bacterium]